MEKMSQSFACGNGSIEHNLRKLKGKGIRQNGIVTRRKWNDVIKDIDWKQALRERVQPLIDDYNKKQLEKGRTNRVKTFEQWLDSVQYTKQGKQKNVYTEVVVQVGDRFTGSPYEVERNEQGQVLDKNGNVIPVWDTRRQPAPKDGRYLQSTVSRQLKKVYRRVVKEFEKKHPNAIITTAVTHMDEHGGCHLHLNIIWLPKTRIGIGVGVGKTSGVAEYLDSIGVKYDNTKRKDNALKVWTELWRYEYLPAICREFGIERQDMGQAGRTHKSVDEYKEFADRRSEAVEQAINDAELAKQSAELAEQKAKQREQKANKLAKQAQQLIDNMTVQLNEAKETMKQYEQLQQETKKRWQQAQDIIDASCAGVKAYIVNHFKVLQETPEAWEVVHKKVLDKYKNKSYNKGIAVKDQTR